MSVAVVLALAVATWWLLTRDTRGAEVATVLALPVAILSLAAAVITTVVALRENGTKDTTLLAAARELAGVIRMQESTALSRLVADTGDTRPANVTFTQPELLYWRSDGGAHRGSLAQIESFYRGLERGRLVVLGEAGAGKTVLAIQLIRDLAAAIVNTSPSPEGSGERVKVPVRLSLPAFNAAAGEDHLEDLAAEDLATRLDQWIAGHLVTVYGLAQTVATALVARGWILPVLDGLDEMDPTDQWPWRAAALVRAVNHPSAHGTRPAILTCRTDRYAQLTGHPLIEDDQTVPAAQTVAAGAGGEPVVVQDATVVGMQPLRVRDGSAYLAYRFPHPGGSGHCERRWAPVLDRLTVDRTGDPLVTALRSPLRLFLAITGYRPADTDPGVLTQYTTSAQLDDHLFSLLVSAVTAQHPRPTGGHYPPADVQRWLTTLARHLHRQAQTGGSATDLRLDTLWPAAGNRAPRYLPAALLTAAQLALMTTATLVLMATVTLRGTRMSGNLYPSALFVPGGAMLVGATLRGSLRRSVNLRRVDLAALRTSHRLARQLASGLAFTLATVLAVVLAFEFTGALTGGLAGGLTSGLAGSLAGVLVPMFTVRPVAVDLPRRVVSQGLAHTATVLAFAPILGLMVGLGASFMNEFALGLVFGLEVGLAGWLCALSGSPWPRYAVACLLLARRDELPQRPAILLDWAYNAGLMRLSGIAVQFRHREFQDWLITTHDRNASAPPLHSGS